MSSGKLAESTKKNPSLDTACLSPVSLYPNYPAPGIFPVSIDPYHSPFRFYVVWSNVNITSVFPSPSISNPNCIRVRLRGSYDYDGRRWLFFQHHP